MEAPTADEVRERSLLLKGAYPSPKGDSELTLLVATAAPLVGSLTGRMIAGSEGEDVPEGLLELARRAITMKTEQLEHVLAGAEDRESAMETANLRSIAAGSWSESYASPYELIQGKVIDADPVLNSVLWSLCTDDRKAEWLFVWDPAHMPGFSVIEAWNYSGRPGGYSSPYDLWSIGY